MINATAEPVPEVVGESTALGAEPDHCVGLSIAMVLSASVPVWSEERWRQIRSYAAEYGREAEVTHASLHLMVNINDDAAVARRESVQFLDHYYGIGTISEEKLASWLAFGLPEAVVEKVFRFIEAGCNTVVMRFTSPDQRGQLERCLTDVMPALRAVAGS